MKRNSIIGIDVGSVSVSLAECSSDGRILRTDYTYHHGKISDTIGAMLPGSDRCDPYRIVCTASASPFLPDIPSFDNRLCLIEGSRLMYPEADAILDVGAEKFCLYSFDDGGSFRGLSSSTSCAAGTGGFLDQQARRLALSGSAELASLAAKNRDPLPKIASRCAVFAKTDIIHAQQEGFSIEQICDGLCEGLARTITGTLFNRAVTPGIVGFTGGVSRNDRVREYICLQTGSDIRVHPFSHCAASAGACLTSLGDSPAAAHSVAPVTARRSKKYHYPPLELTLSDYPDFTAVTSVSFRPAVTRWNMDVETDLYNLQHGGIPVYMGIDIGSTSTKAMLIDAAGTPVLGLYTRTSGRPLQAVQALFEAITAVEREHGCSFSFSGTATTGSGRKFIGALIGSDLVMDEISAHALAACELDSDIDTIIEIGGQDSKFTRLRNGVVTFSQMNNVCAAGTGSFIEEQAERLEVTVSDVSALVEGAASPLASDRCTVFMERDINHLLAEGYSVNEILAAALHSIRENYLSKVASQSIGERICFQGATAKNKALVAAFEQKLERPIFVSRYCHLTGAFGSALEVRKNPPENTAFKGLSLYRSPIPVRSERCSLCGNHCRLRIATINGREEAFGFLCGRDYATERYVPREKAENFITLRREFFHSPPHHPDCTGDLISMPGGLHILPDIHLWRDFFASLGLRAVVGIDSEDPIGTGKTLSGAEFCAPMTAFHAHVEKAASLSDTIFLPVYLDIPSRDPFPGRSCYYTQFSVPVVKASVSRLQQDKHIISPVLSFRKDVRQRAEELFTSLDEVWPRRFSPGQVEHAYSSAVQSSQDTRAHLISRTKTALRELEDTDTFAVVLAGRPYTVLDNAMNKGIPEAVTSLGVPVFYQDMLDFSDLEHEAYSELIDTFHWQYARDILRTATCCIGNPHLYPILMTSFKCSPDSFVIEYFRRILDASDKPYLILQLDEHDSRIGYETRIEAALRSFRNHFEKPRGSVPATTLPVIPVIETRIRDKTLVFPNWDPLCIPLVAANLVHAGFDARVLRESPGMIAESMRMNTGQCIPVNVIAHEYARYIQEEHLDPGKTVLWMARSQWSCNIPVYPYYIKSLLEAEGGPAAEAGVYIGELSHIELSPLITVRAYFAYMFGGLLRKIGCALRPYEVEQGSTDKAIEQAHGLFLEAFRGGLSFITASRRAADIFRSLSTVEGERPLVAIFGDIYVRDNPVMNQDLIHRIERAGGEALVTPYNEYVKIVAGAYFNRWKLEGRTSDILTFKTLLTAMRILEKFYSRYFRPLIPRPFTPRYARMSEELHRYAVDVRHEGESFENILKIAHILEEHPGISLFVQTNPAFCCPSIITESMKNRIEEITGVPVVTITYDGMDTDRNDVIVPYIVYGGRRTVSG